LKLIFIGPPGSGKGTQAKRLASRFGVPHISTGDMLREAVAEGSALGQEADRIMKAGALVPDDVMIGLIRERLAKSDARKGFILDGFPRTLVQAEKLDALVAGNGTDRLRVVRLLVPDDALVHRLTQRRTCAQCGAIYHLENHPPKVADVCDKCGGPLIARPDDTEGAIRKRLEAFHKQTSPVADYYKSKKLLKEVDGIGPVDSVFERIEQSLN
jgi:adenylate kinase